MSRPARITIHSKALLHNLAVARQSAPNTKVMPALKADAYGHGMIHVAETLSGDHGDDKGADGFLVACLSEALQLRDAQIQRPIMVIQGHQCLSDLKLAVEKDLRLVIHDEAQLAYLDKLPASSIVKITVKLDTGMHRLGLPPQRLNTLYQQLKNHPNVHPEIWLMTHLACADDLDNDLSTQQIASFKRFTRMFNAPKTVANSAGIIGWKDSHQDWVRPGIMLYGSSPFVSQSCQQLNLKASMSLMAPLIARHSLAKGDAIGYGSTWVCPDAMTVGVIACGYADGYPRHIAADTSVWINGKVSKILGRVSMDLIVIDLTDIPAEVGQLVECWGAHIAVDDIAESAETISYELLCHAGASCLKSFD